MSSTTRIKSRQLVQDSDNFLHDLMVIGNDEDNPIRNPKGLKRPRVISSASGLFTCVDSNEAMDIVLTVSTQ